jgi:hypothetical protein
MKLTSVASGSAFAIDGEARIPKNPFEAGLIDCTLTSAAISPVRPAGHSHFSSRLLDAIQAPPTKANTTTLLRGFTMAEQDRKNRLCGLMA